MIQFFYNGDEYTTRTRLEAKYDLPHTTLQTILEDKRLKKLVDGNKFYFLRVQVEHAIEAYIQQQLVVKAAKKKHLLPVPKFEHRSFDEHQINFNSRILIDKGDRSTNRDSYLQ